MIEVHPEVAEAVARSRPVVALESAFLTHGLPAPRHLEAAMAMIAAIRAGGAVPAMVAVIDGRLTVGLQPAGIEALAQTANAAKVSRRDLGPVLAAGIRGGTTVSATLTAAAMAGIRVLATGGIGGVHRSEAADDVSADLPQIARSQVAVVCSGAKAILDLPRTLELLETLGVPVVGYRTDELPAFYSRRSGLALNHRVDDAAAAAAVLTAHWRVEPGGVVVAVPPPSAAQLDAALIESLIAEALVQARAGGVGGADETPYLLARLAETSGGRTVAANVALLERNAGVAAAIAAALAGTAGTSAELVR